MFFFLFPYIKEDCLNNLLKRKENWVFNFIKWIYFTKKIESVFNENFHQVKIFSSGKWQLYLETPGGCLQSGVYTHRSGCKCSFGVWEVSISNSISIFFLNMQK